jgi:hypothetical protein
MRDTVKSTLVGASERNTTVGTTEIFMQVWKLTAPNGAAHFQSAVELELIGSHTPDLHHLDHSCPACRRLRARMEFIARTAAAAAKTKTMFEIYTDPRRIVCLPANGQRPSVSVSIYLWDRSESSTQDGASSSVSQVQQELAALGVRSR